jgi:hypothetical protein
MAKNRKINVNGVEIVLYENDQHDFISLTDIARHKDAANTDTIIQNWMRNRNTIEFLGFWETIYNPGFKPLEFEGFKKQAGLLLLESYNILILGHVSNILLFI